MYSGTKCLNKLVYKNIDGFTFNMDDEGRFEAHHPEHGHFETRWGSFSDPNGIKGFIVGLNNEYISGRMGGRYERVSDPKATIKNIRGYIREHYPWYDNIEDLKEAREELKQLEKLVVEYEYDRVEIICERTFSSRILKEVLDCEPWHFIETKLNPRVTACIKAFNKLQRIVKKELTTK